jgi:hypothetical protein
MKPMKLSRLMTLLLATVFLAVPSRAQQKPVESAAPASSPAYRVQVVLSEYDGATKISSLPYSIPVVPQSNDQRAFGSVRVGIRVPVSLAAKSGENSIQYADVGTNLDVRVKPRDAERYELELTLERSWLYVRDQDKEGKPEGRQWVPGDPAPSLVPLQHHFRANLEFLLRDGHSGDVASITDPITGHVLKVETMLTVLK